MVVAEERGVRVPARKCDRELADEGAAVETEVEADEGMETVEL
jgi:hypothetical protein